MPRTLIAPTTRLHTPWLEAHAEWGPGLHEDGFGLESTDDVESAQGFASWVARLNAKSDHATCRWIVEDERIQGGIALRHQLNERTGHIGYGIRPSARGRGLATWALGQILDQARVLTMDRVLLVCAADNAASAKTIEHNGGTLEETRPTEHSPVRRYWIELGQPHS
ncbi:MAG TPA: GNAT family N-acetyltransferase [Kribbella sp.]|uniref:GNAT family N-acetyltransferase n=1 Tax=Kribbella sp. TaxID=1871183 RepID=UPI002D767849|nr:GNAT family N-acetyltransferase [Kribbella sp.]HET6296913.1 GNAT family N-acetyltransferase [Kribbella sp.]